MIFHVTQSFYTLSEEKIEEGPQDFKVSAVKKALIARLEINLVNHDVYQFSKYIQNLSLYFVFLKDTSLYRPFLPIWACNFNTWHLL